MNAQLKAIAHKCLEGAESNSMTFPQIVSTLMEAGFEGYFVDFRRGMVAYYLPSGESVDLSGAKSPGPVAAEFSAAVVREAIREARRNVNVRRRVAPAFPSSTESAMADRCSGHRRRHVCAAHPRCRYCLPGR